MKGTESLGLYPSLLLWVVGGSQRSSIRSKGPRMIEILKSHIPLKKCCHTSVTSPVWNVGRCLREAGPCRKGFVQLQTLAPVCVRSGPRAALPLALPNCCFTAPWAQGSVWDLGDLKAGRREANVRRCSQRFQEGSCPGVCWGTAQALVLVCVTVSCLV